MLIRINRFKLAFLRKFMHFSYLAISFKCIFLPHLKYLSHNKVSYYISFIRFPILVYVLQYSLIKTPCFVINDLLLFFNFSLTITTSEKNFLKEMDSDYELDENYDPSLDMTLK